MDLPPHLDSDHDPLPDELPGYDHTELPPSYHPDTTPSTPPTVLTTLKLKQFTRSRQKFVPLTSSAEASLSVATKTSHSLFKHPPDIQVVLEPQTRTPEATEPTKVNIRFDDGVRTLPWYPRATLKVMGGNGIMIHKQVLESRDFAEWKVVIAGEEMVWCLRAEPHRLILKKKGFGGREVARWVWSEKGGDADHGAYMGELVMFENRGEGLDGLITVATCYCAILYWKKLGRNYRNKGIGM